MKPSREIPPGDLALLIGASIVSAGRPDASIGRVYAGDRISDLLSHATDRTMLVTSLAGPQLIRLAELMDVPALCLACGRQPEAEMVSLAVRHGTWLMVSPADVSETRRLLSAALSNEDQPRE